MQHLYIWICHTTLRPSIFFQDDPVYHYDIISRNPCSTDPHDYIGICVIQLLFKYYTITILPYVPKVEKCWWKLKLKLYLTWDAMHKGPSWQHLFMYVQWHQTVETWIISYLLAAPVNGIYWSRFWTSYPNIIPSTFQNSPQFC